MRPVTSSIDGAESSSEDGIARPAPLPSKEMVAGASYLACTLSAQVNLPSHAVISFLSRCCHNEHMQSPRPREDTCQQANACSAAAAVEAKL